MSKETRDPKKVHEPEIVGQHAHDDDLIVVPKGKSKTRFVLTFLLVVFLVSMFAVSEEFLGMFRGRPAAATFLTWRHPADGEKSMTANDFYLEKQKLAKVWSIFGRSLDRERGDDDTAFFVVMSDLADNAGIRVTDEELRKLIAQRFPPGTYRAGLENFRISSKEFESTMRRILAVERYQTLMTAPLATPDPSEVERLWKARHQEYAFDYVELPVATLRDQVLTTPPTDEELKTWFDELPEAKRDEFKRGAAVSAELAVFPLEGETSTEALFAKYPRPADEDAEAAALEYYNGFSYIRFRNNVLPTDRAPTAEDFYLPFAEVKEAALRESKIYRSMQAWQMDMNERMQKGEAVNVAEEATALGFVHYQSDRTLTQPEWTTLEQPWAGRNTADFLIATAEPGKFLPSVSVDEKALVVGRAIAKDEPRMLDFAEIRERVLEEWVKSRTHTLALEKLNALRGKLGTPPDASDPNAATYNPEVDAAAFAAAASELGFTVQRRDYEERTKKTTETPADIYLRQAPQLFSTRVNTVLKPEVARDGQNAYLVRVEGLRDADTSKMTPEEISALGTQAAREAMANFKNRTFLSKDFMRERYGIELETWNEQQGQTPN